MTYVIIVEYENEVKEYRMDENTWFDIVQPKLESDDKVTHYTISSKY